MGTIFGFQKLNRACLCSSIPSPRNSAQKIQKLDQLPEKTEQLNPLKLHFPNSSTVPPKFYSKSSSSRIIIGFQIKALKSILSSIDSKRDNTLVLALKESNELDVINLVIYTHHLIPGHLLLKDVDLLLKLISFYTKFGRVEEARQVFDNMPSRHLSVLPWNWMILAYNKLHLYKESVKLYFQMVKESGKPDICTLYQVMKACAQLGLVKVGEEIHGRLIRCGFLEHFVLNGLVCMYSECGYVVEARKVFDMIPCKRLTSYVLMLNRYIYRGLLADVLYIFRCMIHDGHEPGLRFSSKILAIDQLPLKLAAEIHGWALRRGVEWNLAIVSHLLVTYSKYERLDACKWLLDHIDERNMSLSHLLVSDHHKHPEVLLSSEQKSEYSIMFVSLLPICAYLGMVKNGQKLFNLMTKNYGVTPRREHYGCMVNLYGRKGLINMAYNMIMNRTELHGDVKAWGALLYSCFLHQNVVVGAKAADRLFYLEPDEKHNFVLLMQIYEKSGRLEDVERVRMMMSARGLDL